MNQRKVFIDGALSLGMLIFILFITFFVPFLSLLSIWLLPLAPMYFSAKYGWKPGLIPFIAGLLLPVFITGSIYGLLLAFFMVLGYTMGVTVHLKKSAFAVLLSGSLVNIALLILYLAVSVLLFNVNPMERFIAAIRETLDAAVRQAGTAMNQDTAGLLDFFNSQIDYLSYLAPALIVSVSAFYALIVELIHFPILRWRHIVTPKWLPFRQWQVPKSIIWLYLGVLVIVMFGQLTSGDPLYIAVVNIQFVLDILLILQGLSFMFYYAYIKKIPKAVTIIVSIVAVLFTYLLEFVKILGIIDLGFNMRKHLKKK
ncbi:DUF2232 domain-containing protein [Sporolactobacillus sp. THM7-7]|nr:DUF2232 domain-containing protein [Sporolactobacillus sp. THM7-7]